MRFLQFSFLLLIALICTNNSTLFGQTTVKIGLLKYNGGGDWYANPSSLPNLIAFCNNTLKTNIAPEPVTVDAGDPAIFNLALVHMTGHGNVIFDAKEQENLRKYLRAGGFLHIDDNYGMDEFIRPQLQALFPEAELRELPYSFPIFHQHFNFPKGLPKIHEHDDKAAQAFGIFWENRLICLYTYECDLGDGWEDPSVHHDSEETRSKALQMGANMVQYVFSN